MANIVTVQEVLGTTNVSVSKDAVTRAQTIIDMICGRSLDDITGFGARDQSRLKLAVCYQAAWMDTHPEVFSTMDVDQVSQEDLSVHFREDREAHLIAPLARACITRLSWRGGMTSVGVQSVFRTVPYRENWVPIMPAQHSVWR